MEQPEMMPTQTCPNCGGRLWESAQFQELQYRCELGHCFTASALVHEQSIKTSNLIWAAIRAVNEKRTLFKRLASNAMAHRWADSAEDYNLAASVRPESE
jgi:two-component system chemotaxis response regulator CheB